MFRELQKRFFFAIFSLQRKRLSNHFTMGVVDKWHYRSVCFLKDKMPNICLVPKWASFYTQGFVWIRWFQHVSSISHIKHIIFLSYFPNIGINGGFWLVNSQFPESSGAILTELQVVAGVRLERSQHGPTWGRSAPQRGAGSSRGIDRALESWLVPSGNLT
jgi:hypothetical protein